MYRPYYHFGPNTECSTCNPKTIEDFCQEEIEDFQEDDEEETNFTEEVSLATLESIRTFLKKDQEFDLDTDLYDYQQEDVDFVLEADRNFLILSEMGTGKTPEIIKIAEELNYDNVLILCPKTLRKEWERQIIQWTGESPVTCNRGSTKRLYPFFEALGKELKTGKPKSRYFILNYDTFRAKKHTDILQDIPWGLIVMDEAHHIRNAETKTTRGILDFLQTQRRARIICLTGSPVVNSPLDIYTLLMVIRPEAHSMKTRIEFLDRYSYWAPRMGKPKVFGIKNRLEFQEYIGDFSIRRLKKDILSSLPDKYRREVTLEMGEKQLKHYKTLATELVIRMDGGETISSPGMLSLITRLRQMNLDPAILGINCDSSKTDFLMELVLDGPSKLVVFSTFATYIDLVSRQLTDMDVNHVTVTGRVDVDERLKRVKTFQEDPHCQVILGTIKTMGEGITLTAASDVVLMDRWWTPSSNNQAIDRLHRPGQKNAVQIINPSNEGSIDQSLDNILKEKSGITDALFSENSIVAEVVDDLRRQASMMAFR